MFHGPRNPSPPDDDFDFFQNMCIKFLKPSYSTEPLELSFELFHKSLFISPASENVSGPSRNIIPDSNVSIPRHGSYENKRESVAAISSANQRSLDDFIKESRKEYRDKKVRECFEPYILEPEKRTSKKKKEKKKERPSKYSVADDAKHISVDKHRKHHKTSKHKKRKSVCCSSLSDSEESESLKHRKYKRSRNYKNISGSEDSDRYSSRKKSHQDSKSSKHRRIDRHDSDSSGSDGSPRSRHSRRGRNLSGSDESNSKPLRYKNKNPRSDVSAADESNSREPLSNLDQKFKQKNNCDTLDSDRLDSDRLDSGSDKLDSDRLGADRLGADRLDSDRMDSSRQYSREDKYPRIKSEPEFDTEDSNYDSGIRTKEQWNEPEFYGPESFFCKVCQLDLNSVSTYESHMAGKKHKKALKAQMIPDLVKSSLDTLEQSKEGLLPPGSQKTKHIVFNAVSQLQNIVDNHTKDPIAGLEFVKEIRNGNEVSFFCDLCDSPCMVVSIMPHLLGFKHQLNCMKIYFKNFYLTNKDRSKKEIEKEVIKKLQSHVSRNGSGRIVVVKVVPDYSSQPHEEAGPSWRFPIRTEIVPDKKFEIPVGGIDALQDLEIKNDYYCQLCDAHMNNRNMYAAHLVGKRHLKNEKKKSGDRGTASKGTKAPPGVASALENMVANNRTDVIVGLEFVRETKNENGELYTCYICGSSCTMDIIDHLVSVKHRVKYLETVNADGSKPNAITTINALEGNTYTREALVLDECSRLESEFGRGKVEIYVTKSQFNQFLKR